MTLILVKSAPTASCLGCYTLQTGQFVEYSNLDKLQSVSIWLAIALTAKLFIGLYIGIVQISLRLQQAPNYLVEACFKLNFDENR